MTKEQIQMLPTRELLAIERSTNPNGKFWLELSWARDELARRHFFPRAERRVEERRAGR